MRKSSLVSSRIKRNLKGSRSIATDVRVGLQGQLLSVDVLLNQLLHLRRNEPPLAHIRPPQLHPQ